MSTPTCNPQTNSYTDHMGKTFTTNGGGTPQYGTNLTSQQNGQTQQGWWNGSTFVPNK